MAKKHELQEKVEKSKNKGTDAVLFDRFGEFDSYKELNESAAGLKEEGDIESLKVLAKENGIGDYEVEDYIDGLVDELTTPVTAALGRLAVEVEALDGQIGAMCKFYAHFAEQAVMEREDVAIGVMRKGARIKGIYDAIYSYASKHKSGGCFSGSTTDLQDKELVIAHYTGQNLEALFDQWFK